MSQIELRTALNAPLLPPDGAGEGRGAAGIERARAAAVDAGTLAAPREAGERALRDMPPPDRHLAGAADPGWGAGFVKVSWGRGPGCPKPSASTCREGERWRFPAGVWRA